MKKWEKRTDFYYLNIDGILDIELVDLNDKFWTIVCKSKIINCNYEFKAKDLEEAKYVGLKIIEKNLSFYLESILMYSSKNKN